MTCSGKLRSRFEPAGHPEGRTNLGHSLGGSLFVPDHSFYQRRNSRGKASAMGTLSAVA